MRQIALTLIAILLITSPALAKRSKSSGGGHSVKGHFTKTGTYVAPTRTMNSNHTQHDNYSAKGNYNPGSGKRRTRAAKK